MHARQLFLRISKFLGKALLGLLLVLIILVALVHLNPVQKKITRGLSNYLSSRTQARVEIQRIDFSILGNVAIDDLEVWDPDNHKILSVRKIEITSSILNLISGDLIFDEIHLEGVKGQLIQSEEGLNIQFIIDAFQSTEKQTTGSKEVQIRSKNVVLENIIFEFTSTVNGTSLTANLGKFISEEASFSTNPNKISANKIYLEHTAVNVLSSQGPDTISQSVSSKTNILPNPDFGTGIIFDIKDLEFKDNDFSFHRNQVLNTPKFDPLHLSLKSIQLNLADIVIRKDTLAASLKLLSGQMPGFTLDTANAAIRFNPDRLVVSNLHLVSNKTELQADLTGWNELKLTSKPNVDITARCKINPGDLTYFFSDSVMNYFKHWKTTVLDIEGNYAMGSGVIKTVHLKTENSKLHTSGRVYDVWDPEKMSWKGLVINLSIGSDGRRTLVPFLQNIIKMPPGIKLQARSSGNLKSIAADVKIFTAWGDVKATGMATRRKSDIEIEANLTSEKVDLEKFLEVSMLGPIDLSVDAKGRIGKDPDIEMNGLISSIELLDQPIQAIKLNGTFEKANVNATLSVEDPKYQSEIHSEISFAGPLLITTAVQLNNFSLGSLLDMDSSLSISGELKSEVKINQPSIEGYVEGKRVLVKNQSVEYLLDTVSVNALISPAASEINYYSDHEQGDLVSNFDVRDLSEVIQTWSARALNASDQPDHPPGTRVLDLSLALENPSLFQVLGIKVEDFSSLRVTGRLHEQKQTLALEGDFGKFKGYGLTLDTLHTNLTALGDSVRAILEAKSLLYASIPLGDLNVGMFTNGDTTVSNLVLATDSISILRLGTRTLPSDSGVFVYPDKLQVFETEYSMNRKNPIFIEKGNIVLEHFLIASDDMQISMDGDLKAFDVKLRNVDLTPLNFVLSPDTTLITKGHLTGMLSYSQDKQLQLDADIDSLILFNSNPLTIAATALSDRTQVPFEFLLTNTSNKIHMKGEYFFENDEVDAALVMDVNDLDLLAFLVSGVIDEMNGAIKGEARITGPIQKPVLKGYLKFHEVELSTVNPNLTFNVDDDIITLDSAGMLFRNFKIYDQRHNPLTINGNLTSPDYRSFAYDLKLNTEQYNLIDKPDSASGKLRGTLVIDSDLKLKGNEKDTDVQASITVKDATNLTFVVSNDDIELLKTEGIIDFIDPALLLDSIGLLLSDDFYDSLIAGLPDFNLNSTITIEDNALLRVLIDEQSGDYIETSGAANLELDYDRTGNVHLSGNYVIKKGVYRLSFYDLVKKNFQLVQGSSINWTGSPENGDLDIKAILTVESNSLGLIGHEIGENEKSIYKRSLDYQVGININGTIEKPIISFSLDLPQEEKVNYPVLANKLDRLRQPEYESELNKQVFGLLVLGGFLPESSGSDINSNLIATTALSNSVNSLLASQLNRFASQYIKGVNIDVGIQSYSDYSTPGGKTQTAMDFRVSKSVMDDRLSFEIGGDFDINQDQSGTNTGTKNYRGDMAIIYDLTGRGDKKLKLFNNETYDIIYQEIRNTGISLVFIREFGSKDKDK